MVERQPSKLHVAGSRPVSRSNPNVGLTAAPGAVQVSRIAQLKRLNLINDQTTFAWG